MFFVYALVGALVASILVCIPALHVYNVAGLLLLLSAGAGGWVGPDALPALMIGLVTGYAMLNTIPSIFLSAPDESTIFVVLPGQKYLMQRRGWEATLLTGVGGLGGIGVLVLLAPVATLASRVLRAILQPHLHWILLSVVVFMLMSEWPKGTDRANSPWKRLADAWSSLVAGLVTFFLSGLLGFILLYRSPLAIDAAYQNLMPAFIGLFAIPWVLQNIRAQVQVPPQYRAVSLDLDGPLLVRGVLAGALGGLFAAFFPIVTGGIGGFLAAHATAQRDDRLFLISQGATKMIYYAGGLLLLFVPGLHLTRGGMAWMLGSLYTPYTPDTFYRAIAAVLFSAVVAFFLLLLLARGMIQLVTRVDYVKISAVTLVLLVGIVLRVTGPVGLLVATVATGIGLIPVLWGSRRMNCLGVLLLPLTLNMAGVGGTVAMWLGLI